ncbi:IMP cyclohydrolase [Bengtsoniella intestinalis]|uniref:IMP cyclohydrolase n=1 Tax=Bengtsoniella intestinalis TaxID=3073143 RepID=UPI00391FBB8F
MSTMTQLLTGKPYPGRGIVLGQSADGASQLLAYFIMGRSENSRNRVFTRTDDGIQTEAFDPSKMVDPSLIIYHPVRTWEGMTIVTNGDQTDTIWEHLKAGKTFKSALNTREFEPDPPHFTSRISGLQRHGGGYVLSILKALDGNDACCVRSVFDYDTALAGTGHFIHTYQENLDPLPAFQGEPRRVTITANTAQDFASEIWNALDADNRISLYVQCRNVATGAMEDVLINKNS